MDGNILYKYRALSDDTGVENEFTKRLLFNGQIYLSDFESLNDPFEGRIIPKYTGVTREKVLKSYSFMESIADFNTVDWQNEEKISKDILNIFTSVLEPRLKQHGVLCVSSDYDNDLMWTHYADSHKGVCVGFDAKKLKELTGYDILPVNYSDKRPEVLFSNDDSHISDCVKKMLTTKSIVWGYENEYRMIALDPKERERCCFGAVREIYLGCRIEKNKNFDKDDFIRRIKNVHSHCDIKEMIMNIDTLKIESRPIPRK